MKKLFALLLVLTMAFSAVATPLSVTAAPVEGRFVVANTEATTDYYNPGDTVYLTVALEDITLDVGDGISALEFEILYDDTLVTPVADSGVDNDGDNCDFTFLMDTNPGNAWEGFGVIRTETATISLGFADFTAEHLITSDTNFSITIPFLVLDDVKSPKIVFDFTLAVAYNKDLSRSCDLQIGEAEVLYALQPKVLSSRPSEAVEVHIAGYKHDFNNVVFYACEETTVGEYVNRYMDPVNGQDQMKDFAIIIVNEMGYVEAVDYTDGDKSEAVIPQNGYLLGVHSEFSEDIAYITEKIDVGYGITLYNINVEATGTSLVGIPLTSAGFTVSDFGVKAEADAYYEETEKYILVYHDNVTAKELKSMFLCGVTLSDVNGEVADDAIISTGTKISGSADCTVVIMGDCTMDGIVDIFDCLSIKANFLRGEALVPAAYRAACLYEDAPSTFDYLAVKGYYFGRIELSQFRPQI